jgi:cell division protein FtsB
MSELEARIKELEAEVAKLKDEVFYWRTAFDRALVAFTNLERKLDGKPEEY